MSEDFGARIAQIRATYSEKKQRGQDFTLKWHKAKTEMLIPVLKISIQQMTNGAVLCFEEEKDGTVVLKMIPSGGKSLSFRPNIYDDAITITSSVGGGESIISFENLSVDLIESYVEDFLKNAL